MKKRILFAVATLLVFSCSRGTVYDDGYIHYEPASLTKDEKSMVKAFADKLAREYDPADSMCTFEIKAWNYHTDALSGAVLGFAFSVNGSVPVVRYGYSDGRMNAEWDGLSVYGTVKPD